MINQFGKPSHIINPRSSLTLQKKLIPLLLAALCAAPAAYADVKLMCLIDSMA